jgi:hypothetical protein
MQMNGSHEAENFGIESFYWLQPRGSIRDYGGTATEQYHQKLTSYSRGTARPSKPVLVAWGQGGKVPSDVVWIGVSQLVISERMLDKLRPFTGWTTYPVEVYDGWGRLAPGYAGLAITGRCGRMTDNLARIEEEDGRAYYVGAQFPIDTWDCSDIFYPTIGLGPVVTDPLHQALQRAKITNLIMTPLAEIRSRKTMVDRMIADRRGPYAEGDDLPDG